MGEDAEPGAPRPAHHPPVAQELVLVLAVVVHRDRQRASRDLVQVQREHADHRAGQREEPAAAEARIRRARDDGAIQQVLPVRLELADVDHEPAPDAALLRARRCQRDHGVAGFERVAVGEHRGRESLALHLEEGEAHLEVLGDQLRARSPALDERDLDRLGAHDDVVHGEDQPRRVDDHAAAEAVVAQDLGRGVVAGDDRVDVDHGRQQVLDELDGGVHRRWLLPS